MRSFLAGLLFLGLATAGALGQVTGFVESIGFNNVYRPDCWTPMMVNLRSQVSEPMSYQLQVWQEDLDRDRVVYTKDITLSPSVQDKFQLYFIPRPTDGSLPINNPAELQRAVQVRVCLPPKSGTRPEDARVIIDRLPVQFSVDNADPVRDYMMGTRGAGKKLILWVGDGASKPQVDGYTGAVGMNEGVWWVQVPLSELGENVLYYHAADAVLWLGANADDLDKGGAKRLEALEEYVREGGHLVVCQPIDRARIAAFAGLLPIEPKDAADKWLIELRERPKLDHELDVLPRLAEHKLLGAFNDKWDAVKGPISIGVPSAIKPEAVIERAFMEKWDGDKSSPYIIRRAYGLGAVTWVAQDLGNPNLRAAQSTRWPYVWDHVFGWNNDTHVQADTDGPSGNLNQNQPTIPFGRRGRPTNQNDQLTIADQYATGNDVPVDLGQSLLRGMDFQAKGAAYIFVAVLFFIGYWIVAGPGTYLFLSNKKKREWNWFAFGFWAFVATALTLGVVRLLLRGSPEVRHQTIVRVAPGQPAFVHSRIGLYIPRDGYQSVELKDTSKDAASFIAPFNIHPAYLTATDYPAAQDYAIPVHDDPQPVRLEIPYRSTLKKLQARWIGESSAAIAGAAQLMAGDSKEDNYIGGRLSNQTGGDLWNVYMVFHHISRGDATGSGADYVFYMPRWNKDALIDLQTEYNLAASLAKNNGDVAVEKGVRGALALWAARWYKSYATGGMFTQTDTRGDDFGAAGRKSFVLMSLVDRLPPDKRDNTRDRVEFLRRGGHDLDLSASVGAGQLVILAESKESDRPLPFPFVVDGDKIPGEGTILYQFVLPLDRSEMVKALETTAAAAPK